MRKIAITGASGHLGTALINVLLASKEWEINAQFRSQHPPIVAPHLHWIQGDLSPAALNELVENATIVIHCAAIISITGGQKGRVVETNIRGSQNVIDVCINNKIKRLIHVSSTHALQELPKEIPLDETRPYKTSSDFAYDYSKAKAEQLLLEAVKERNLDALIVRPSAMIGPADYKPSLMGEALLDISKGKIPAVVAGGYDCVDVRDVAQSIVVAIDKGRVGESYNLTGRYFTIKELAEIAATIGKVKAPKMVVPNWVITAILPFISLGSKLNKKAPKFTKESTQVLLNGHKNMSHAKATIELGHTSRSIYETIQDLLEWFGNKKLKH